jgi:hypothetical protein
MRIVVPLAGPDFIRPDGSVKAEIVVQGQPMLCAALGSRPWAAEVAPEKHVFVMADRPETRAFASGPLARWYPGAAQVFLGQSTRGAALSALAGVAMSVADDGPLIVDLADILFASDLNPGSVFSRDPECGAIALAFQSKSPSYSYLRLDHDGRVVEAAEKRVISTNASAGTYVFADASVYLTAVAHALRDFDGQHHNGLLYVCPLFNGVLAAGYNVQLASVTDVFDIKQGDFL